jgi:hypothetical protein
MDTVKLVHVKDFYWAKRPGPGRRFDSGVFANVIPYKDYYLGVTRYGAADQGDIVEAIKLDHDLNIISTANAVKGEDPRTFLYKGEPHGITWDPHNSVTTGSWIFHYKIINLVTGKVTTLSIDKVPDPKVEILGKNWIPLVKDNELYFIIAIDPELSILKCNLEKSTCKWVTPFTEDLDITISRGGTSLIYNKEKDIYFGLGHRTHDCHNHSAFLYTVTPDLKKAYVGPDLETSRDSGVADPLSIYQTGNQYFTCIAHSPIQLGDTTEVTSALYEIIL